MKLVAWQSVYIVGTLLSYLRMVQGKCAFSRDLVGEWNHGLDVENNNVFPIEFERQHLRLLDSVMVGNNFDIFKNGECHMETTINDEHPRYIIRYMSGGTVYYRCIELHWSHRNVISLKQGTVSTAPSQLSCSSNEAGAILVKRSDMIQEAWPSLLQGDSFSVTYATDEDCLLKQSDSTFSSCAADSDKRMHLKTCDGRFNTHMSQTFQCVGTWEHDNGHFIIAQLDSTAYRCMFVREMQDGSIELTSALNLKCENARGDQASDIYILTLNGGVRPTTQPSCEFPSWLTPYQWWDHAGSLIYTSSQNGSGLAATSLHGKVMERHVCHQHTERVLSSSADSTQIDIVTKAVVGCSRGYQCLRLRSRSPSAFQLMKGSIQTSPEEACSPAAFVNNVSEFLVAKEAAAVTCPLHGQVDLSAPPMEQRTECVESRASFGCDDRTMFTLSCGSMLETFTCRAVWREEGTTFVVVSTSGDNPKNNVLSYEGDTDEGTIRLVLSTAYGASNAFQSNVKDLMEPPYNFKAPMTCPSISPYIVGDSAATAHVHTLWILGLLAYAILAV